MKTSELLTKAKERINTPEKWCKGELWRTKDGTPTRNAEEAFSCCGYGAITAASFEDSASSYAATDILENVVGNRYFDEWNDAPERTHADVMAAFDRAIAIAKEKEAE